jgi:hypothetical protein
MKVASSSLPINTPTTPVPTQLSRQHRAWVALYALDVSRQTRTAVLQLNNITEADLTEFEASWLRLRCRNEDRAA